MYPGLRRNGNDLYPYYTAARPMMSSPWTQNIRSGWREVEDVVALDCYVSDSMVSSLPIFPILVAHLSCRLSFSVATASGLTLMLMSPVMVMSGHEVSMTGQ